MRVIHLIPSVFDYFDDIRTAAFDLLEKLTPFGVESEAFTFQFSTGVTKKIRESVGTVAPSHTLQGVIARESFTDRLNDFDIVHVHTPIYAGMNDFLIWRKAHPFKPLIVTYYRPVRIVDAFSALMWVYNLYYRHRLWESADLVAIQPLRAGTRTPIDGQVIEMDSSHMFQGVPLTDILKGVQLEEKQYMAAKYALLYNKLIDLIS